MTALNTQTVGQSLTLQCEVTTAIGIDVRVDIVWSSGGMELERIIASISTIMGNSLVHTESFMFSELSTSDEDRIIQCTVVIYSNPLLMATNNVTLNVTGEY